MIEGSSESDSGGGAGEGTARGAGWDAWGAGKFKKLPLVAIRFGGGDKSSERSDGGGPSGLGVSSTVECFPVVQGGIERNSSNVKNRGLQHFQPIPWSQPMFDRLKYASERAPRHLSGLHEILGVQGGRCILLQGQ